MVYACRVAVFAAGSRSSSVTRSSSPASSRVKPKESSDSPTPARRRPRRSASATRLSSASSPTSRRSSCPGGRSSSLSTRLSGALPKDAVRRASRGVRHARADARWSYRASSSSASAPTVPLERALPRSRATSTRAVHRPRTEVVSGGPRPCAPFSSARIRPTPRQAGARSTRRGRSLQRRSRRGLLESDPGSFELLRQVSEHFEP